MNTADSTPEAADKKKPASHAVRREEAGMLIIECRADQERDLKQSIRRRR